MRFPAGACTRWCVPVGGVLDDPVAVNLTDTHVERVVNILKTDW